MGDHNVYAAIGRLVQYGIDNGLLEEQDRIYTINRLLERMKLDEYATDEALVPDTDGACLEDILKTLNDYAVSAGQITDDTTVYRDLFDTELMNCLLPRPSEVTKRFYELYGRSPKEATDYYYAFSRATDYIRTYRVARDMKWVSETRYGDMVITINLSKPEKDPKAIAAALKSKQSSYPKCQLCAENEGYAGRIDHPARANHRIIPITVNGSPWFLQYSPYVYYNEHCIVFNREHTPMKIDHAAFDKLLDFVRQFPHYCVGSNADLPIVGGSILTHDHFQGGCYEFPMAKAPVERSIRINGFTDVEAGIVKWPMTVVRIAGTDVRRLADCADSVLRNWREYGDRDAFIFPYTDAHTGEDLTTAPVTYGAHGDAYIPHNTITPIARMRDGRYELDLVLRNNITTEQHPLGVYHPHAEHHHIKKENIGLIEVMGLAILPARLKSELEKVCAAIVNGEDLSADEAIAKHTAWATMIRSKYSADELKDTQHVAEILRHEVAHVYREILEQCAVFKRNDAGREQLDRFIASIKQ